jgi:hypothetical protein
MRVSRHKSRGWDAPPLDISHLHVKYPVAFADIEIPGNAPDYTPRRTTAATPCAPAVQRHPKTYGIPPAVDRADLNGFAGCLTGHSSCQAGVYSAPGIWAQIFGTGTDASLPSTCEWTYEPFASSLPPPSGSCLSGTPACASFFGGQTSASKYALMWQWSGGGGSSNGYGYGYGYGYGDCDQIDASRTP